MGWDGLGHAIGRGLILHIQPRRRAGPGLDHAYGRDTTETRFKVYRNVQSNLNDLGLSETLRCTPLFGVGDHS
jgi:hypothetical protein